MSAALGDLVNMAKKDPRAWAHRILEREARGEKLPPLVLQKAKDALSGEFRLRKVR